MKNPKNLKKPPKTQTTVDGQPVFKSRNMKIIKSGSLKFYPPSEENPTPEGIMEDLKKLGRKKFYVLASGGKDSVSICHWMAEQGLLEAVVHIKTNIGFMETTMFIRNYCKEMGWKYYEIEPSPKFTYASHVLQYGFPGPGFHNKIMGKLKYKTMRDFALTIDRKEHCLISGVRKMESDRRNGNYVYPIQSDGALWFCCPFFYKTSEEIYKYVHENGLKITPMHAKLGMSGECMCGSFAGRGEKELIRELDPPLADYIEWLEEGIKNFGTYHAKRYPTWGGSVKMSEMEQQKQIDEFDRENPDLKGSDDTENVICGNECGPGTLRGLKDI